MTKRKNRTGDHNKPIIFIAWLSARKRKYSLLLDKFSLRSQQLVPNYFLYPYKCPDFHLRKILPQFIANKHFVEGDRHYGSLRTKLANLTKFSREGDMTKRAERWPIIG